jgi:hypothetical protein
MIGRSCGVRVRRRRLSNVHKSNLKSKRESSAAAALYAADAARNPV